jgi:CBS domain-containing protein
MDLPSARDVMSAWPLVLDPDTDLDTAIEKLVTSRVSGAAVLDDQERLLGVLTEKDALRILANAAFGELTGGRVRDYMSTVQAMVTPQMDVVAVAHVFLQGNFPVLPVVEGERAIGRIRRFDLVAAISVFLGQHFAERVIPASRTAGIEEMQRQAANGTHEQLAQFLRERH